MSCRSAKSGTNLDKSGDVRIVVNTERKKNGMDRDLSETAHTTTNTWRGRGGGSNTGGPPEGESMTAAWYITKHQQHIDICTVVVNSFPVTVFDLHHKVVHRRSFIDCFGPIHASLYWLSGRNDWLLTYGAFYFINPKPIHCYDVYCYLSGLLLADLPI